MKKIFCDHCGKELTDKYDYIDTAIEFERGCFDCDLCKDCMNLIQEEISNRLNEFIGVKK